MFSESCRVMHRDEYLTRMETTVAAITTAMKNPVYIYAVDNGVHHSYAMGKKDHLIRTRR